MDFGLQLYSVRDFSEKDFKDTLRRVAEIGYKKVEAAGFYGYEPKEIREWADELGIEFCSAHCGFDMLDEDFNGAVAAMKALGCAYYTVPWAFWLKPEFMDENIAKINKYQPMLEAEGIIMQFHSHRDEFLDVEGRVAIDEMYNKTKILLQVDTFWAYAAGKDPIEVLKKYGDRIKTIHLKDGVCKKSENGEDDVEGRPLGCGDAPVSRVVAYARENGLLPIVESENLNPDGITEVTNCYKFLEGIN